MSAARQAYEETREIELPAPNLQIGNVGTSGGRFESLKKWTAMQVFSKLRVCHSVRFVGVVSCVENASYAIQTNYKTGTRWKLVVEKRVTGPADPKHLGEPRKRYEVWNEHVVAKRSLRYYIATILSHKNELDTKITPCTVFSSYP